MYKDILTPRHGEYVGTNLEPENIEDKYEICIKKGHPKTKSKIKISW